MTLSAIDPVPLLANGFDWLEALLPILFVVFWIVSQLFAAVRKIAGPAEKPKVPPLPIRPLQPVDAERKVPDMQDEIREFLRRSASADRGGAADRAGLPMKKPALPGSVQARSVQTRAAPPRAAPSRPQPREAVRQAAAVEIASLPADGSSIAEKVKEDFAKELDHLSTPLTSDRSLVESATASPAGVPSSTAELIRALRSPASLRGLVIVREILERPTDRW